MYDDEISGGGSSATSSAAITHAAAFDRLYEENKDRLKMDASDTYPVNDKAVSKMRADLNATQDAGDRLLGAVLTAALRHVSFCEFYSRLTANAREAVALCDLYDMKIHLLIDGSLAKSSVWCALLVWPVLRDKVVSISTPQKIVLGGGDGGSAAARVMILQIDDAAYSGMQMRDSMAEANLGKYAQMGNVVWGILVGAMSARARAMLLHQASFIRVIGEPIKIESINDVAMRLVSENLLTDQDYATLQASHWRTYLSLPESLNTDLPLIYFDHKLADSISTNPVFLTFAPTPRDPTYRMPPGATKPPEQRPGVWLRSLITRCSPNNQQAFRASGKIAFDDDDACPPAFYKRVLYTVLGRNADQYPGSDASRTGFKRRVTIDEVLTAYTTGKLRTGIAFIDADDD